MGGGGAEGASRVVPRFLGMSFGSLLLRSGGCGGDWTSGCVMICRNRNGVRVVSVCGSGVVLVGSL